MLQKLLLLMIIAILYSPFGLNVVQAETTTDDNKTVSEMLQNDSTQTNIQKGQNNSDLPKDQEEEGKTKKSNSVRNQVDNQVEDPASINEAPPEFESQFTWFDFVKMFFALGVVIALIYIVLRFINTKNRLYGQTKTMENLGGIPLGTNRSIQLVRIGDRVLVVGVGETIQLLKEITSPEEIEQFTNSQNQVQPLQVGQELLKKVLPKNDRDNARFSSGSSFSSMFKSQLDELSEGRKKVYDKFKRDQDE